MSLVPRLPRNIGASGPVSTSFAAEDVSNSAAPVSAAWYSVEGASDIERPVSLCSANAPHYQFTQRCGATADHM